MESLYQTESFLTACISLVLVMAGTVTKCQLFSQATFEHTVYIKLSCFIHFSNFLCSYVVTIEALVMLQCGYHPASRASCGFLCEEEKSLSGRRSPNFWTSQSCFLSSNCFFFFDCEHPFIDKLMVTTEPMYQAHGY